jgi:CRP-like cAMP-binding protein
MSSGPAGWWLAVGTLVGDPHMTRGCAGQDDEMRCSRPDLIRVFEHDPDLLQDVPEPAAAALRARLLTHRVRLEQGPWQPPAHATDMAGHLGLLVVEGLLVRTMRLVGRECSEIVGPGDLLRPWDGEDPGESVRADCHWRVLEPTTLAALDAKFAARTARWPTIAAALLARSARRCRSLVHQATIAHVRNADARVLLVLWHLADRWGRVTPRGVVLRLSLTHQLLAQLTCLQRPTVSSALGQLAQQGQLTRLAGGGWILHGEPPAARVPRPDERVAA